MTASSTSPRWPVHVCDVSLDGALGGEGLADVPVPPGPMTVRALVWLHGVPVGHVTVPVVEGRARGPDLAAGIAHEVGDQVAAHLLADRLARGLDPTLSWRDLLATPHAAVPDEPLPPITVAVCTRGRPDMLRDCLAALQELDHPQVELLVVDNAPSDDRSRAAAEAVPGVRYVVEPRPGLDHARNAAIAATRTELLAFTDDDVLVDASWASVLARAFRDDPEVMAVTGLVVPAELCTEAQALFEHRGGFLRGYRRTRLVARPGATDHLAMGRYGTGANMAFRVGVFERVGTFDPALDVGTATNGGGDLEMFFRVVEEGHPLLYEPAAVVRHRHRRHRGELAWQLDGHGAGLAAYLARTAQAYPHHRGAVARFWLQWLVAHVLRRRVRSAVKPTWYPADLQDRELRGLLQGHRRYRVASGGVRPAPRPPRPAPSRAGRAVVELDLAHPVADLPATDTAVVQVFPRVGRRVVGGLAVTTAGRPWPAAQLRVDLAQQFGLAMLDGVPGAASSPAAAGRDRRRRWAELLGAVLAGGPDDAGRLVARHVVPRHDPRSQLTASIVVATRDRPDTLRTCLASLTAVASAHGAEVVVVDNQPASGLTRPVLDEFPDVVRVAEPRAGLAYARNAGFHAARGEVLVCTDDDVVVSPGWLDALLAPFARADVGVVTGNVLPLELDTPAQQHFEGYGGLGRGGAVKVLDPATFEGRRQAVPTWEYGATANAAFRRTALLDPEVGLLEESLGPGTPTGVGEDTYLFYRLVKRGWTLVYNPDAVVWHRHRRSMEELHQQLRAYSTGHVAYHLTTALQDGDLRGLAHLATRLPRHHLGRAWRRLRGRSSYPLDLLATEVRGHLAGPAALWRSRRRVRELGRSTPLELRSPDPRSGPGPA